MSITGTGGLAPDGRSWTSTRTTPWACCAPAATVNPTNDVPGVREVRVTVPAARSGVAATPTTSSTPAMRGTARPRLRTASRRSTWTGSST